MTFCFLALMALVAPASRADDEATSRGTLVPDPRPLQTDDGNAQRDSKYRALFVKKARVPLEVLSASQASLTPGESLADHPFFADYELKIRKDAERTLRRQVLEHVLELTNLASSVEHGRDNAKVGGDAPGRWRTQFGASHGLPKVKFGTAGERSAVDFTLGLAGSASVGFRPSRWNSTRVSAGYYDHEYNLSLRFGF